MYRHRLTLAGYVGCQSAIDELVEKHDVLDIPPVDQGKQPKLGGSGVERSLEVAMSRSARCTLVFVVIVQ